MRAKLLIGLAMWVLLAGVAYAAFDESERWFSSLSEDERFELQASLILLGHYNAFVDGEFGPSTYKALTAFQSKLGMPPSGVLSGDLVRRIQKQASDVSQAWGIDVVEDAPSAATLFLPKSVLTVTKGTDYGSSFATPDYGLVVETFRFGANQQEFGSLYNELSAEQDGRTVSYKNFSDSRFIISGRDHEASYYMLFFNTDQDSIGFSATWTDTYSTQGPITAAYVASYFVPTMLLAQEPTSTPVVAPNPSQQPKRVEPWGGRAAPQEAPSDTSDGQWIGSFYLPNATPDVIALTNEITGATPLEFIRALKARPNATVLILNSPGGLVDPALVVAHEVRERKLDTLIIEDFGCYSACAFIYFAGHNRLAAGELGVHQLWNEANDLKSGQAKLSDVVEALDEFDVAAGVLSVMLRTPPESMHVFTPTEIDALGVNTAELPRIATASPTEVDVVEPLDLGVRVERNGGNPEFAGSVSFPSPRTQTVADALADRDVPHDIGSAIQAAFSDAYGLSFVPKQARIAIDFQRTEVGDIVPYRVMLSGLPQTYKNGSGKAAVVRLASGTYVRE